MKPGIAAQAVRSAQASHDAPAPRDPPLTLVEAAAYLNVTERFMRRLVAERRVAFHKLGHLLRFCRADLDVLLLAGRVEAESAVRFVERAGRRRARLTRST